MFTGLIEEIASVLWIRATDRGTQLQVAAPGISEEIRTGDEETRRALTAEIQAGDERVLSQARSLHEELISRLALLQEGNPRRGKRR